MFSQERSFDEVRILLQIKIIYTGHSLTLGLRYLVTLTKCPEVLLQLLLGSRDIRCMNSYFLSRFAF